MLLIKFQRQNVFYIHNLWIKYVGLTSNIHTTSINNIDQAWRKQKRIESNPNVYGPLTNKPDYTFLDGKPTPIGVRYRKRLQKQKEMAAKIVELNNEIDFAVTRRKEILEKQQQDREEIINSKLKSKGHLLLKK